MILFLDTETTGLYPGQIAQLSYIMQEGNGYLSKNMFFTVDYMESGAQRVHGFSVEKLRVLSGGATFKDRIEEIKNDFERADLIVSHNTAFDFMFLRREFENAGEIFTYKDEYCSMKNTTAMCKIPKSNGRGYKYPRLSELCEYFEIDEESVKQAEEKLFGCVTSAHDARFDTAALFLALNIGMNTESSLHTLNGYL